MKEAFTGAATAVVQMLQSHQSSEKGSPVASAAYHSPLKTAQLRSSCLEDLKKLKELYEEGVLTQIEFTEQKESILRSLKNLS